MSARRPPYAMSIAMVVRALMARLTRMAFGQLPLSVNRQSARLYVGRPQ